MSEVWKDIPNYEGKFQASNLGRIKRLKHTKITDKGNLKDVDERIETLRNDGENYFTVDLEDNKFHQVHRVIAETFIPNPENKPIVNHIDGNMSNNKVSNLEWVTQKENMIHYANELGVKNKKKPVRCLETGKCYESVSAARKDLNLYCRAVERSINTGRPHGGYTFEYIKKEEDK